MIQVIIDIEYVFPNFHYNGDVSD